MTSLCFFHLPGPKSTPESDAQPNDFVFVVPFKYIDQAMKISETTPDTIFVSYKDNSWDVSKDKLSEKMAIEVIAGEIVTPEIYTTV